MPENPDDAAKLWEIYALHVRLIRRQGFRGRMDVLCDRVTPLHGAENHPDRTAFVKGMTV